MIRLINRKCPICNSDEFFGKPINSAVILDKFDNHNFIEKNWQSLASSQKPFFSYHRCKVCKLLYCPTYLSEDSLSFLYSSMSYNMNDVELNLRIKTQDYYLSKILNYRFPYGSYLEIGADIGLFTKLISSKIKFSNLFLIEPNNKTHIELKKIALNNKLKILNNLTEINEINDQTISIAVGIHVIDHLVNPLSILKLIYSKISINGIVVMVNHDENSLMRKFLGSKWPAFCMQHPQLYSKSSIEILLKTAGFKVIGQEKTKNYFSVNFLINTLLRIFNINYKFSYLNFPIGLKLGNIITIAKKI